jgi:hypothetical protein
VALLGFAVAGCGLDEGGLVVAADQGRRSPGSPGQVQPPAVPVNATLVVRAETLTATHIAARVIYAEKIEAEQASVVDLRHDDNKLWQSEGTKGDLSFNELRADTVYSKTIKVVQLEAEQVFVKDLKISKPDEDEDKDKDKLKDMAKGKGKTKD